MTRHLSLSLATFPAPRLPRFFRGAIIGNGRVAPTLEAGIDEARETLAALDRAGIALDRLTDELLEQGVRLFAEAFNRLLAAIAAAQNAATPATGSGQRCVLPAALDAEGVLRAHLNAIRPGDYFAVLAYLGMAPEHHERLQSIRATVREATGAATCLGYGPRFLRSTGQAYKGGPANGVFLQITADDPLDLPIPGQGYSFGTAQTCRPRVTSRYCSSAAGARCACISGAEPEKGLAQLDGLIRQALSNSEEVRYAARHRRSRAHGRQHRSAAHGPGGHRCVVFDRNPPNVAASGQGAPAWAPAPPGVRIPVPW